MRTKSPRISLSTGRLVRERKQIVSVQFKQHFNYSKMFSIKINHTGSCERVWQIQQWVSFNFFHERRSYLYLYSTKHNKLNIKFFIWFMPERIMIFHPERRACHTFLPVCVFSFVKMKKKHHLNFVKSQEVATKLTKASLYTSNTEWTFSFVGFQIETAFLRPRHWFNWYLTWPYRSKSNFRIDNRVIWTNLD